MFPMMEDSAAARQRYLLEKSKGTWLAVTVGGAIAFGVGAGFLCIVLFMDVNGSPTFLVGLYSVILILGLATLIAGGVGYSTLARLHRAPRVKPIKARPAPAPVAMKEPEAAKEKVGPADKPVKVKRGLIPAWLRTRISQLFASLKSLWPKGKAAKKPLQDAALGGAVSVGPEPAKDGEVIDLGYSTTRVGTAFKGHKPGDAPVVLSTNDPEDLDKEIAARAQAMGRGGRLSNKQRPPAAPASDGSEELQLQPFEPVQAVEGGEKK